MLRDPKVIEYLNTQLTNELTAVNQYFLHARTLEHWGVAKLGEQEYAEFIGEMKHADELIKRILFLDGLPNVQRLNGARRVRRPWSNALASGSRSVLPRR